MSTKQLYCLSTLQSHVIKGKLVSLVEQKPDFTKSYSATYQKIQEKFMNTRRPVKGLSAYHDAD